MSGVLRVRCCGCHHVWVAAYLPMDVGLLAALAKHAACPKCGCDSVVVVPSEGPISAEITLETPEKLTRNT